MAGMSTSILPLVGKTAHSVSERTLSATQGRFEQKIAKFTKSKNQVPLAAFEPFSSNLIVLYHGSQWFGFTEAGMISRRS